MGFNLVTRALFYTKARFRQLVGSQPVQGPQLVDLAEFSDSRADNCHLAVLVERRDENCRRTLGKVLAVRCIALISETSESKKNPP